MEKEVNKKFLSTKNIIIIASLIVLTIGIFLLLRYRLKKSKEIENELNDREAELNIISSLDESIEAIEKRSNSESQKNNVIPIHDNNKDSKDETYRKEMEEANKAYNESTKIASEIERKSKELTSKMAKERLAQENKDKKLMEKGFNPLEDSSFNNEKKHYEIAREINSIDGWDKFLQVTFVTSEYQTRAKRARTRLLNAARKPKNGKSKKIKNNGK